MTATTTSPKSDTPVTSPGAAFSGVLSTALDLAAAKVGVQAGVQGKNPVWAAVKGAWAGGSTNVKAAIVTAAVTVVLLLVLSPVLLLVFLLTVLIVAAVSKARSTNK